jgi:fatty-acid desaturase
MSKDSALPGSGLSISYSTAVPVEPKEYKGKNHPLLKKQRNLLEPNSDNEYEDDEKIDEEQPMRKHGQPPVATEDYDPHTPWRSGTDWLVVGWIAMIHVGALAAPIFFLTEWPAMIFTAVTIWISASWGICLGYHRLLTHNSFQTYRPVRWALALLGSLTGEGSALTWVANHRCHHQFSDKDGDPHSPRDGTWWSHMLWFMPNQGSKWKDELYIRFAPDLYKDPVIRFLDKTFLLWHWVVGVAVLGIAYAMTGNWKTAWGFVFWGVFFRMFYTMHITWFVNSASHKWGYRNYRTTDDSTNLWWVGILAFGEGWHNNHHAFQRMAKHGHKWWEIDVTYWTILAMEKVGLAWNVVKDPPKHGRPA